MLKPSSKASFLAATALAGALALPLAAHAADVGQCLTTQQVKTDILGQEKQILLVAANQDVISPVVKTIGLIFTADAQGRTGYMLQADTPIGVPSPRYCVSNKFTNVHINIKPGVPAKILEGTDPAIARQQCEDKIRKGQIGRGGCTPLQDVLMAGTKSGGRILFWGTGSTGAKITLGAEVSDDGSPAGNPAGGGVLLASSTKGATIVLRVVKEASLTGEFLNLATQRQYPIVARMQPR